MFPCDIKLIVWGLEILFCDILGVGIERMHNFDLPSDIFGYTAFYRQIFWGLLGFTVRYFGVRGQDPAPSPPVKKCGEYPPWAWVLVLLFQNVKISWFQNVKEVFVQLF